MLTTIAIILIILWLLGLLGHIGGALIYALLVVALVLFILDHTGSRRL